MSKLTLLHINIIGLVVLLIVSVALYFTVITGAQDQIKTNQTAYDGVKADANKLPQAKAALKKAQDDEVRTKADYANYRRELTPTIGYGGYDRVTAMMRLWWPNGGRSWPERFLSGFKAHMREQSHKHGVTWENPEVAALPSYGPDPNTIDMGDKNKTLVFGPYPMVVRGKSFLSLMNHISDWNSVKHIGVPVVDGVQLNGNSPNLTANYNVTWTLILEEEIPKPDPLVSGSGGGGGGGRGGGMGGPMMGGGTMNSQMMGRGSPGGGAMTSSGMAGGSAGMGGGGAKGMKSD